MVQSQSLRKMSNFAKKIAKNQTKNNVNKSFILECQGNTIRVDKTTLNMFGRSPELKAILESHLVCHSQQELDEVKMIIDEGGIHIVRINPDTYHLPFEGYWDYLNELDSDWRKKDKAAFEKMSKVSCKEAIEIAFKTRNPYDLAAAKTKIVNHVQSGRRDDEALNLLSKAEMDENFFSDENGWSIFFRLTD